MAFLLAFFTAVSETVKDISARKVSSRITPDYLLFMYKSISTIFIFPFAVLQWKFHLSAYTLLITLLDGFLNLLAFYFYLKAISLSPVSLVVPLLSFSPALLLITSPLILKEIPNPYGLAGVLLIVLGSYILYLNNQGILSPFKAMVEEKGARYMLLTVLLWSITANLDKIGVRATSPIVWVFLINFIVASGAGIWIYLKKGKTFRLKGGEVRFPVIMGIFDAMGAVFQMIAITMTLVPYVISIKRLSVLLSVIAGTTYLKEGRIIQRTTGAALMLGGSILIILNM